MSGVAWADVQARIQAANEKRKESDEQPDPQPLIRNLWNATSGSRADFKGDLPDLAQKFLNVRGVTSTKPEWLVQAATPEEMRLGGYPFGDDAELAIIIWLTRDQSRSAVLDALVFEVTCPYGECGRTIVGSGGYKSAMWRSRSGSRESGVIVADDVFAAMRLNALTDIEAVAPISGYPAYDGRNGDPDLEPLMMPDATLIVVATKAADSHEFHEDMYLQNAISKRKKIIHLGNPLTAFARMAEAGEVEVGTALGILMGGVEAGVNQTLAGPKELRVPLWTGREAVKKGLGDFLAFEGPTVAEQLGIDNYLAPRFGLKVTVGGGKTFGALSAYEAALEAPAVPRGESVLAEDVLEAIKRAEELGKKYYTDGHEAWMAAPRFRVGMRAPSHKLAKQIARDAIGHGLKPFVYNGTSRLDEARLTIPVDPAEQISDVDDIDGIKDSDDPLVAQAAADDGSCDGCQLRAMCRRLGDVKAARKRGWSSESVCTGKIGSGENAVELGMCEFHPEHPRNIGLEVGSNMWLRQTCGHKTQDSSEANLILFAGDGMLGGRLPAALRAGRDKLKDGGPDDLTHLIIDETSIDSFVDMRSGRDAPKLDHLIAPIGKDVLELIQQRQSHTSKAPRDHHWAEAQNPDSYEYAVLTVGNTHMATEAEATDLKATIKLHASGAIADTYCDGLMLLPSVKARLKLLHSILAKMAGLHDGYITLGHLWDVGIDTEWVERLIVDVGLNRPQYSVSAVGEYGWQKALSKEVGVTTLRREISSITTILRALQQGIEDREELFFASFWSPSTPETPKLDAEIVRIEAELSAIRAAQSERKSEVAARLSVDQGAIRRAAMREALGDDFANMDDLNPDDPRIIAGEREARAAVGVALGELFGALGRVDADVSHQMQALEWDLMAVKAERDHERLDRYEEHNKAGKKEAEWQYLRIKTALLLAIRVKSVMVSDTEREIRVETAWRKEISEWFNRTAAMVTDATLSDELLGYKVLPGIQITADVQIEDGDLATWVCVTDSKQSYGTIVPKPAPEEGEESAANKAKRENAERNTMRLTYQAAFLDWLTGTDRDAYAQRTAMGMPKDCEEYLLREGALGDGDDQRQVFHFGNVAGINSAKNHQAVIIASRVAVSPEIVERMTAALTGQIVVTLKESHGKDWWLKRTAPMNVDGKVAPAIEVEWHPDRLVELMRHQITNAEAANQMGGRGRTVSRINGTDANPVLMFCTSNVPNGFKVDYPITSATADAIGGEYSKLLTSGLWFTGLYRGALFAAALGMDAGTYRMPQEGAVGEFVHGVDHAFEVGEMDLWGRRRDLSDYIAVKVRLEGYRYTVDAHVRATTIAEAQAVLTTICPGVELVLAGGADLGEVGENGPIYESCAKDGYDAIKLGTNKALPCNLDYCYIDSPTCRGEAYWCHFLRAGKSGVILGKKPDGGQTKDQCRVVDTITQDGVLPLTSAGLQEACTGIGWTSDTVKKSAFLKAIRTGRKIDPEKLRNELDATGITVGFSLVRYKLSAGERNRWQIAAVFASVEQAANQLKVALGDELEAEVLNWVAGGYSDELIAEIDAINAQTEAAPVEPAPAADVELDDDWDEDETPPPLWSPEEAHAYATIWLHDNIGGVSDSEYAQALVVTHASLDFTERIAA